jgi:hypothetical protein
MRSALAVARDGLRYQATNEGRAISVVMTLVSQSLRSAG